jgi:predicted site-specific integrase-resolvase
MNKYISISEVGAILGVTTTTLRRWESNGNLVANYRTFGNHRRYCLNDILELTNQKKEVIKKTICYSRVSTHEQKPDLERQTNVLEKYSTDNQLINTEYINDIGSGLNYKKKGLNKLIKLILNNEVDKLIITHKDRLLRFGSDLLISIANQFNVETVILNNETKTFEQELSSDVLEIITVFSAKLYGSRSHKNKKLIKTD